LGSDLDHVAGIAAPRDLQTGNVGSTQPVHAVDASSASTVQRNRPWAMFCLKGSDGPRARRQFGTCRDCTVSRPCTGAPNSYNDVPPGFERAFAGPGQPVGDAFIGRHYIGAESADDGSD
jgi:hypothetical protein